MRFEELEAAIDHLVYLRGCELTKGAMAEVLFAALGVVGPVYQEADVREAVRTALRIGNDMAAWNSGMSLKDQDAEVDEIMYDLVEVGEEQG